MRRPTQRALQVLWAAFLTAAVAELVFFATFDPFELHFFGRPLDWSRQAIYALGFFGFWGLGVASATLAMLLAGGDAPRGAAPDDDLTT